MADLDLNKVVTAAVAAGAAQVAANPGNNVSNADVPAIVAQAAEIAAPQIAAAQATFDYATNNESLATSYSFTGGLTAALGAISGITMQLQDGYQPAIDNPMLIPQIVTLAGIGWVLYGRLFRSKPIGK